MLGVAIIGAGICGLRCAEVLQDAGITVKIFDKGRGVGGRLATRRHAHWRFDHGAPSLHGDGDGWGDRISRYPRWHCGDNTTWHHLPTSGINQLAKDLAGQLHVQLNCQIDSIEHRGHGWHLIDQRAVAYGPFPTLIVTAPCPQTHALIKAVDSTLLEQLSTVRMSPAWAMMLVTGEPIIAAPELRPNHRLIRRISAESSKPGRALDTGEYGYVVEATDEWSRQHEEDSPAAVETSILSALQSIAKTSFNPLHCAVHRWRYAQTEQPLDQPYLFDPKLQLAAAGDWCFGEGAGGAYRSGEALATALLGAE